MKMHERMGNSILGITVDDGICNKCKHIYDDGQRCKAFPKGIPSVVLTGEHKHTKPYRGDNGIRFEPVLSGEGKK